MSINRIDKNEIRKVGRPGITRPEEAPPPGIAPILRSSWKFARDIAQRFSRELMSDRTEQFLKNLAKKFT